METLKITVLVMGLMILSMSIIRLKGSKSEEYIPDKDLIIGMWQAKDDANIKMVFTTNGIEKDYINGELEQTYNWSIEKKKSPSGLTFSILKLINAQNSNGKSEYLIDALDKDHMILVAQSDGHISRTTYIRQ